MDEIDVITIESDDDDCICTFWPPEKRIKLSKNSKSFVKKEKIDEEIEKMARKIAKSNKLKMRKIDRENTANLQNMMQIPPPTIVNTLDSKWIGKFGWETLPKLPNGYIPYIFRDTGKYCSIKMLQTKYMSDIHKPLYTDILKCPTIISHCMTLDEVSLMNEINICHSNEFFGEDLFTSEDMLISLHDTIEYYEFFNFASLKMTKPFSPTLFRPRCGFVFIDDTAVPYCVKNGLKLIPLAFIDNTNIQEHDLDPWDMAYLKLCCIFGNIDINIITNDQKAISLEDLRKCLPKNTINNEEELLWTKNRHKIQSVKKIQTNEKAPSNLPPETSKSGSSVHAQKIMIQLQNKEKTQILSTANQNALNKKVLEVNVENENKKYIQLPDAPLRKKRRVDTFTIQKVLVINKLITCINHHEPNKYESHLLTINDLVEHLMPNTSLDECEEILRKNNIDLYRPNKEMRKILLKHKKIKSLEEMVTLVQVVDVIETIPKLRN